MPTAYHAKYFAHDLTRQAPSSDPGRLSMSLFDATVDLNPHQIEAALFALNSPLSKGAIRLQQEATRHAQATISRSLEANNSYFNEARDRLDKWAEDMVLAAEKALRDTKEQIKALKREARQATTLQEQMEHQEKLGALERKQRKQRQEIFAVEDEIMAKRDALVGQLETRLSQKTGREPLFAVRWRVV